MVPQVKISDLVIDIGRVHRTKCEDCNKIFDDDSKLKRHKEAKVTMDNIDPKINPRLQMKLELLNKDEICFYILSTFNQDKNPLLILHSWNCWSKVGHCCPDSPESTREENAIINMQADLNTTHTYIGNIVMGDLAMAGCYIDWDQIEKIVAGNLKTC